MPIYEYLCPDGHRFEVVQRFSDDPVELCEVCEKPVQRVLHAPAVHYKGKGFYSTDYGRKGANGAKPDAASASSDSAKDGGSSGEAGSSSESKAAPKAAEPKSPKSDTGAAASGSKPAA
jgi:putative FmdB family regulatory protein